MKIRYFVCGLGYDTNNCITDYERSFGDFDTVGEAKEKFEEVIQKAENHLTEFFNDVPEVFYWHIQLEKCECTDEYDECIDVIDEIDIYKSEVKQMRNVLVLVEVNDDKAIAEDMGTIDYLEREFGRLKQSEIFARDMRILDNDDPYDTEAIKIVDQIFANNI